MGAVFELILAASLAAILMINLGKLTEWSIDGLPKLNDCNTSKKIFIGFQYIICLPAALIASLIRAVENWLEFK